MIIPEFDPRAMARAIADLAADPRERARLGGLARQRSASQFHGPRYCAEDSTRIEAPYIGEVHSSSAGAPGLNGKLRS